MAETRFAKKTERLRSRWIYTKDRGRRDNWSWGKVVWRGLIRYFAGDCEDFISRLIIWMKGGSKRRAIKAIKTGEFVFWKATTLGDNGKYNHAVIENTRTGEFSDVIYGKAAKRDGHDREIFPGVWLIRRISPRDVLIKLGEVDPITSGP